MPRSSTASNNAKSNLGKQGHGNILVTWSHTTATTFLTQGEATTSQGGSRNEICVNSPSGTRHLYTPDIANLYQFPLSLATDVKKTYFLEDRLQSDVCFAKRLPKTT